MSSNESVEVHWPRIISKIIHSHITSLVKLQSECTVMLTGGRSALLLYEAWALLDEFGELRNVKFYFGDERCVPIDHPENNYGLVMRTLFKFGIPHNCKVVRMVAERVDRVAAAASYESQLPERIDLLILSVGEDGHIASIFPHSAILREAERRVAPVLVPKSPPERLTITPLVIAQANKIFVMAIGQTKAAVYRNALIEPNDIETLPARLVLNATWFLDRQFCN